MRAHSIEQLDAVKDQLLSEDNAELRQSVFSSYLEEPERGANMIIACATDKGHKLDASPSEIVDYLGNLDDDDIDVEMTPEMLTSISDVKGTTVGYDRKPEERKWKSMGRAFNNIWG